MGSNNGRDNERPVHRDTLKSFYISATEVTFAQYDIFCDSTGRRRPSDNHWGRGLHPVINVSWYDAVAYCRWLSGETRDSVCLPSEAEYEYAARGGDRSKGYRYSGGNHIDKVAWDINNSGLRTHNVATKRPNELGLYDMNGNVWEWCEDWYHTDYDGAPTDGRAWTIEQPDKFERVVRGGSWYDFKRDCRVTSHDGAGLSDWNYVLGFRIARDSR